MKGKLIDLSIPRIMGILNITPDSFYDGGKFIERENVLQHVNKLLNDGADFIDVGGYSSRPGASDISEQEELTRVVPVIELLSKTFPSAILSVDTFRASVALRSVDAGASMVNDISGGELDPEMFNVVAKMNVPYILMHMRGTPQTMKSLTDYNDLIKDITDYFSIKVSRLESLGVTDIIIDPGFGFSKTTDQGFDLLNNMEFLRIIGRPILAGLSRKSMIWKTLETTAAGALNGTTVLNSIALLKGAQLLRVHDVKEAAECVKLFARLTSGYKDAMTGGS